MILDGSLSRNVAPSEGAVLLVDDERLLLDLFAISLAPHFEVVKASSVSEARIRMTQKDFKVVVCDHLMPGGNGLDFLVEMREQHPHIQRVLVTGYMKPEMLSRSVSEAALHRLLLKPVSFADLMGTVQEAARIHDASVGLLN